MENAIFSRGQTRTAPEKRWGTTGTPSRPVSIRCVLLVDCYYNGPSGLELRMEYLETILEELKKIKVIVYIIPGRAVETVNRFRNPLAVKTPMNVLVMPAGPARRPLGKMNREGIQVIRDALSKVYKSSPK